MADLLDDQADHLGRRDAAVRGGRVRAHRPGQRVHPGLRRRCGCTPAARTRGRSPVPATEPVRIWHLLTHTSGLTYGFHRVHPVDALYRAGGFEWGAPPGMDLAEACDRWAGFPLLFQPGTEWNYSVVHRRARPRRRGGLRAAPRRVLRRARSRPLGMTDTAFWARPTTAPGWPRCTPPDRGGQARRLDALGQAVRKAPARAQRGRRPGLHRGRLRPVPADAADRQDSPAGELDGTRLLEPAHGRLHGPQPPAGRPGPGDVRPAAVRRVPVPRRRLRPRLRRRDRPGRRQGARAPPASCPGAARPAPRSGSTRRRS